MEYSVAPQAHETGSVRVQGRHSPPRLYAASKLNALPVITRTKGWNIR